MCVENVVFTVSLQFALKKIAEEETEELPRFCLLLKKKQKNSKTAVHGLGEPCISHVEINAPPDKYTALKRIVI